MKCKDKCDSCNKFGYCRGYAGKVLCENCIELLENRRINMEGIERIKVLASEVKDKPLLKIIDYLISRTDMSEKYLNEDKNLSQMISFIKSLAKKEAVGNVAFIEDEVVYGWAIHYWDESNESLKLEKATNEEPKTTPTKIETTPKTKPKKTTWHAEGQLSLFDMM